jgi:RNA polymerase sigma factor (sigma-70 family)
MSQPSSRIGAASEQPRRFVTTHWSLVLEAVAKESPESQRALATLCETYWYPLYAYVRRRCHSAEDAQDLTQDFFATLLEKQWLKAADRERGRFRTFLLTAFQRFVGRERARMAAEKRGGGRTKLAIDFDSAERRYRFEPSHHWTPERLYERRWALTLLEQVLAVLEQEYAARGKEVLFGYLKVYLTDVSDTPSHAEVAKALSMTEGAVKIAVHRLRHRYRELLRAEIGHTVTRVEEVDDELNRLLHAFRDIP